MRIPVFFITLGCQKAAHILVIGNLHKIDSALCKLPIKKLETAFWHPNRITKIIPKTVFVYISYIVQMQMEPDNSECSPLPLKTAIPNRPPLAVQP